MVQKQKRESIDRAQVQSKSDRRPIEAIDRRLMGHRNPIEDRSKSHRSKSDRNPIEEQS